MSTSERAFHPRGTVIEDPPIARALFNDVRFSWVWLIVRVYLGWQYLAAGWDKLQSPSWMDGGAALRSVWERATQADPAAAASYSWYSDVLRYLLDSGSYTWVAKLTAIGETLLGIALILGLATGIAAFLGSFLSLNELLVGSGLVNPVLIALAIALMLGWKTAGWIGLDRWLLPMLGTPWRGGLLFQRDASAPSTGKPFPEAWD